MGNINYLGTIGNTIKQRISNNGFETLIFPGKTDGTISIYEEYGSAESIQDAIQNFKSCLHSWK